MVWTIRSIALLLLLGVLVAPLAIGEDDPPDLRIEASVSMPHSGQLRIRLKIEPDGSTEIAHPARTEDESDLVLTFRLTPEEFAQARSAVDAAGFFGTWGPRRQLMNYAKWDITVRLGDRERERQGVGAQPEFEPLERHLGRFVEQARITAELRRTEPAPTRRYLLRRYAGKVAHPQALVPEIVACAARQEDPERTAATAELLLALPAVSDWARGAEELLQRLEGDRRDAVLVAWVHELYRGERAEHRAAFAPLALKIVDSAWRQWPSMAANQRRWFDWCLAMLLRERAPQAFDIAERMARTLGKPGKPVVPAGLVATGAAAIPITVRLLDDPDDGARASGAELALSQISVVRGKQSVGEPLSEAALAALERDFGQQVVPALERYAGNEAEPYALRTTCLRALDRWDGRVEKANAAAREAQAAERQRRAAKRAEQAGRASHPAPAGDLTIRGRLLDSLGAPFVAFRVHAVARESRAAASAVTTADGSFCIEGLAAGTYDLGYSRPGERLGRYHTCGHATGERVAAGGDDVVLRLPGSLICGRLFDLAGAPAAGRRIIARMRDAPHEQGPTYGSALDTTDEQGRFWLLSLMPGVYDVTVPGHLALSGATGIEAGPEERTIHLIVGAAIAGRVLDETGAALVGVRVSLTDGTLGASALQGTQTAADGSFRLVHLDPLGSYRVRAALGHPDRCSATADEVAAGTLALVLRIDTTPRLCFRVDYGGRGGSSTRIRLEHVDGEVDPVHHFRGSLVNWCGAPEGTWRVFVLAHDVDQRGLARPCWIELDEVTTGEPEKTLTVPH